MFVSGSNTNNSFSACRHRLGGMGGEPKILQGHVQAKFAQNQVNQTSNSNHYVIILSLRGKHKKIIS